VAGGVLGDRGGPSKYTHQRDISQRGETLSKLCLKGAQVGCIMHEENIARAPTRSERPCFLPPMSGKKGKNPVVTAIRGGSPGTFFPRGGGRWWQYGCRKSVDGVLSKGVYRLPFWDLSKKRGKKKKKTAARIRAGSFLSNLGRGKKDPTKKNKAGGGKKDNDQRHALCQPLTKEELCTKDVPGPTRFPLAFAEAVLGRRASQGNRRVERAAFQGGAFPDA